MNDAIVIEQAEQSARKQADMQQKFAFWSLALLLVAALTLSGGGIRFPLNEMIVQLAAIPALVFGFSRMPRHENWPAIRMPVMLLLAGVGLAVLQVVPLPPAIWQSLPGRDELVQAAILTDQAQGWRSWSINPELTMQSALSLMIPLAVILLAGMLAPQYRRTILYLILALILVHLIVGFMQALSGGESFYLYDTSHKGLPIGLFGNRNHTAQLFLMGIFLTGALLIPNKNGRPGQGGQLMLAAGIMFVLTFAIVATNSRTVSLLLLPAYCFFGWVFIPPGMKRRGAGFFLLLSAIIAAAIAGVASWGKLGVLNQLFERYSASEDHRFEFWPDSLQTMWAYFPFGSGLGSFDMVFRAHEKLTTVGTHYVNNAHNDYLEIAIETGIFGPLLIGIFTLWALMRLLRTRKDGGMAIYGAAALVGVMMHSLVDYPLRSYAILSVAAMLLSILALPSKTSGDETDNFRRA